MLSRSNPLPCAALAASLLLLGARPADRALESELRALLAAGQAEPALARAVEALELEPDSLALLDLAGQAADKLGRADEALWYWTLASDLPGAPKELAARVAARHPSGAQLEPAAERYAERLFKLADAARSKKLYANAVDLLARCRGTRFEKRADERRAQLYQNQAAVEALLASGLDVPVEPPTKKPAEWIEREDPKHAVWETAWEFKSPNYTVVTDIGYELGARVSLAMEQMNALYREVFQYKQRGGNMARCKIHVYRTREEFDQIEGERDKGVKGFFVPGENRVATYDPRSDGTQGLDLWLTLFHEASHQFTHAISDELIPAWLNEGTASYFEGARIGASGHVETNLVPESRLGGLRASLQRGSPRLREVVSYFQPGSYPGEYYPFGWGLVYFMHNYEDERCERVYLEPYRKFLASYGSGGGPPAFERFVEYFVEQPAQEGVGDFDAFAARFAQWIEELGALHFGGANKADAWLARARAQREHGVLVPALASYGEALQRRPADLELACERAAVLEQLARADAALFAYRRVQLDLRAGRGKAGDREAVAALCGERVSAIEAGLAAGLREADAEFSAGAAAAVRARVEAGLPRYALHGAVAALALLGGDEDLAALAGELRAAHGIDERRWRALPVDAELAGWSKDAAFRWAEGSVEGQSDGFAMTLHSGALEPGFRFEVRVELDGESEDAVAGLVVGANEALGGWLFGLDGKGGAALYNSDGSRRIAGLRPPDLDPSGVERLAVEVGAERAEFFANGRSLGSRAIPGEAVRGRVGMFVRGAHASFEKPRVLR